MSSHKIYEITPPSSQVPSYLIPLIKFIANKNWLFKSPERKKKSHCYNRMHLQEHSLEKGVIVPCNLNH